MILEKGPIETVHRKSFLKKILGELKEDFKDIAKRLKLDINKIAKLQK